MNKYEREKYTASIEDLKFANNRVIEEDEEIKKNSSITRIMKDRKIIFSLSYLVFIYIASILLPYFNKYNFYEQDIDNAYIPIKLGYRFGHYLGTDALGRDFFVRLMQGIKISITLAVVVAIFSVIFGVIYGSVAGYYGGYVDIILFRIIEIIVCIPNMIYLMLIIIVLGNSIKSIILALILTRWIKYAIITRGEVIRIKSNEYITASRGLGANFIWILVKHIIPNIYETIIVKLTLDIPLIIFSEAFLSFMGLGVPIPYASLGNLISMGYREIINGIHLFILPSVCISSIMLSFNVLGENIKK